jgi:hypothetical protein
METVLLMVIATGITMVSGIVLLRIYNKEKRKRMNHLLHRFSELGSGNNLTFSSQEILHDCIIGLDGVNRKILVAQSVEGIITRTELIDLFDVKTCSVIRQYGSIKGGELRAKKLDTYLEKILLHFNRDNQPPVEVLFYHYRKNGLHEIEKLAKKARHWELLLSKMIHVPARKIA